MRAVLVFSVFFFVQAWAWAGPISSGGGGYPVQYQADAISKIMHDVLSNLNTQYMFMHRDAAGIDRAELVKAVEYLGSNNGSEHYIVTTDFNCRLFVDRVGGPGSGRIQWQPRLCN